jgi:hypothetical protein
VSQRPPEVKPGVIPLRPLGVGEILDGAITTMRRHWKIMLGLSACVVAVTSILQSGALYLFLRDVTALESLEQTPTVADVAGLLAGSVSAFAFTLIFGLIAQLVLQGVLTVVVSRAVLGEQVTLADAWARARRRLLPLLGLSMLLVLLFGGVFLAGLAPGLLALAAGLPTVSAVALFALGVLVAVPLVIYLYVTFALSAAALVLERQPVRAALGRSRRLVRGSWWRVFGILLLSTIIAAVIGQIISIPFGFGSLLTYDAGNPDAVPGLAYFVLNTLGASIAGTITYPFSAGVAVLLYVDLRMRREALDLELARAAGVTLPGAPVPGTTPTTW